MKKIVCIILSILLISGLSACGASTTAKPEESAQSGATDTLQIVTTVFPIYDWVKNIVKTADTPSDIYMLLDSGVDLHSYQPTAADLVKISQSDLFIYVGGESDKWVEDAIASSPNQNLKTLNLLEVLGSNAIEEQEETEANAEEEEEEEAYDEHIWLSVKNAAVLCDAISEALCEVSPENAEKFRANAASYIDSLKALDEEFASAIGKAENKTLVFGDRFPFIYLFNDYGLDHFAAFSGCSAESEASFETITFLAAKIDELGLDNILVLETGDGKLAETIISNTSGKNQAVITLNSMQSVTDGDSADYLALMEENLQALKDALHVN